MKCMRPDCALPAVRRVRSKYASAWWHGCTEHWPAMHAAMYWGQSGDGAVVHVEVVR